MKNKNMYSEFYKAAKEIIGERTPLKADCGLICDRRCCKGDDGTGMLLFPGEETNFNVTEKDGVRLAVCVGVCKREERPLSCMIFPLFPYMDKKGRITAVADIRGIRTCPLIAGENEAHIDMAFRRRVARLGRHLKRDEECRKFLAETSAEIDLLLSFYK